jgi:alpha-galactosidase
VTDVPAPDQVFLVAEDGAPPVAARRDTTGFSGAAARVDVSPGPDGLGIDISEAGAGLARVALRWRRPPRSGTVILGDAWERSYGDLQWRSIQPERVLPWYWLGHHPDIGVHGMGVRVRPAAFCCWTVDEDGVTLWLDVRSGAAPVLLGERRLRAATVVCVDADRHETPMAAHRRLCRAMCDDPLLPSGPVVGANNWYYAYGRDFGPREVLRDADTIVELAGGSPVRPYCVVDAGWNPGGVAPGGPWTAGIPGLFDDMAALAKEISGRGARPGIWMRPAALSEVADHTVLRSGPRPGRAQPLDLSRPENLQTIAADVRRMVDWGFELIKHDFSTFDHFARWGFQMGMQLTDPGWHPADRTLTNAEVLLGLYRTIRTAAGSTVVIGCNTVGHLAAGLVEIQRAGDDTSGKNWERTRRMGVNTLAFRLAQHRTFFALDPDCVPCTPHTPWEFNRQFLDLVARSGTPLFVSVDPVARTRRVDADLRAALKTALDGGDPGDVEPLDWLRTSCPREWRTATTRRTYSWLPDIGGAPYLEEGP